jgi:NADPH:quinone reductase-like Zn-dependent oxidoreductase
VSSDGATRLAWRLERFGIAGLALREEKLPELSPHDVELRVDAVSLNYRDLLVVRGEYDKRLTLPHLPGSDAAGEIVRVGPAVTRFSPGDRAVSVFAPRWIGGAPNSDRLRHALGAALPGTFASALVMHEDALTRPPAHVTSAEAATLPCAAVTAWHALVDRGGLRAGQSVLVQGSGGVSVFALQIARAMGARVIATSSSEAKRARLLALGAHAVLDYRADPEWGKAVRALEGGRGVDHVVEVGGAGTLAQSLRAVAVGGHIHVIGVLAGASETLSVLPVLMNEVTLAGVMVGSRDAADALYRALEAAAIHPVLDRVFPFAELPQALAHLEQQKHFGKVVVTR